MGAEPTASVPWTATTAAEVALTTSADQATTRTTSSTSVRPRTSHGAVTAASAHTTAGANTPVFTSAGSRWSVVCESEPIQVAGGGTPGTWGR